MSPRTLRNAHRPGVSPPDQAISPERLEAAIAELGVPLPAAASALLCRYADQLLRWNRVHNLTAAADPEELLTHHLLDCLAILPVLDHQLPAQGAEVADIGSGGGLPGVVLAIARPDHRFHLLDKVEKKVAFLQHLRGELRLSNIHPIHSRAEAWQHPGCDAVVTRALASLAEQVACTRHLLRPPGPGRRAGCWLAMKGPAYTRELPQLPADVLHERTINIRVPDLPEQRFVVVLRAPAPALPTGCPPDPAPAPR